MRYIYIICLLMSSFFTIKNCFATQESIKYAFFLPQNIFQENTSVEDIEKMKPRYEKKDETNIKEINPSSETLSQNSGLVNKMEKPKISLPYVRKKLEIDDSLIANKKNTETKEQVKKEPLVAPIPPEMDNNIKEKLNQYTLDNDFGNKDSKPSTQALSKEDIIKNEINKRLAAIPYSNRNLPKFKQSFSDYGSDLRILYHRGRFPNNHKKEETLAKVNSSRRFEVK